MLEKYFAAGQKEGIAWIGKILRTASFVPARVWIIVLIVLLLGARPVMTFYQRPAHVSQTAAECGSIGSFWGLPAVNHAGPRIAYAQATETGLGIFMNAVATGKSQMISEFLESNSVPGIGEFGVLAWSTDDASFAYTRNLDAYLHKTLSDWSQEIVVCDARTGTETVAASFAGRTKWPTTDSFFTWLSGDSFAFVNGQQELHLAQKQDGRWTDSLRFAPPPVTDDPAPFITTVSSNRIVWLQGNTLLALDASSSNPPVEMFVAPATNRITKVSYSPETGQFLLTCRGNKGTALWRLLPGETSPENPSWIESVSDIRDARWINGGKGCAYVRRSGDIDSLVVQPDFSAVPVSSTKLATDDTSDFSQNHALSFTVGETGKRLFISGIISNDFAPSIWAYNIDSKSCKSIVSGQQPHWLRPGGHCPLYWNHYLAFRSENQVQTLPASGL